jgi:hypothetical protein
MINTSPHFYCLICDKGGYYIQIGGKGWQFAEDTPFQYVCGQVCADIHHTNLETEREARKAAKKAAKEARKTEQHND